MTTNKKPDTSPEAQQRAIRDFWNGLLAALKSKNAQVQSTRDTGWRNLEVNGETITLAVTPVRARHTPSWKSSWSGVLQLTLDRGYRYQNTTWRTRKDGWPFGDIADEVIEWASQRRAQAEATQRREDASEAMDSSREWKTLVERAAKLRLHPTQVAGRIELHFRSITIEAASALVEAFAPHARDEE